jgi:hypothetical protein
LRIDRYIAIPAGLLLAVGFLIYMLASAEEPYKPQVPFKVLTPQACNRVAEFLYWVADYRDVKSDKAEIKRQKIASDDEKQNAWLYAEIDAVFASTEEGDVIAKRFFANCVAPRETI